MTPVVKLKSIAFEVLLEGVSPPGPPSAAIHQGSCDKLGAKTYPLPPFDVDGKSGALLKPEEAATLIGDFSVVLYGGAQVYACARIPPGAFDMPEKAKQLKPEAPADVPGDKH